MDFSSGMTPSSLTRLGATSSDAQTAELQTLLKQLGYYQGAVDGIFGGKTTAALEALWMALGEQGTPFVSPWFEKSAPSVPTQKLLAKVRAIAAKAAQQQQTTPQPAEASLTSAPVKKPSWLTPTLLTVGALGVAVTLYLMLRPGGGLSGADADDDDVADDDAHNERMKRHKEHDDEPSSKKCARSPDVEWAAGEAYKPVP